MIPILIVEDNEKNMKLVRDILQHGREVPLARLPHGARRARQRRHAGRHRDA